MVKVVDVTEEVKERTKKANLEKKLAKDCFKSKVVELTDQYLLHVSKRGGKTLANKWIGRYTMRVCDEDILPQARTFAEKYESQFGKGEFIIETDYSNK